MVPLRFALGVTLICLVAAVPRVHADAPVYAQAPSGGDKVFFYHSSCEVPGIYGIAEVCSAPYPDDTQFDRKSRYYDAAATREAPRWFNVDVKFVKKTRTVGLAELRGHKALAKMQILQRGNRLSITPVTKAEWDCIQRLLKDEG